MVNDLAVPVHQIHVPPVGAGVHLGKQLLDAAEIHVYQQNAPAGAAAGVQLHHPAQGNDPVIAVAVFLKQILHMRDGKVQVLDLGIGRQKPVLGRHVHLPFQVGHRGRADELPVRRKAGDADEVVLVGLIEETHLGVQRIFPQIGLLDARIIHGVRHPHHVADVRLRTQAHLIHQLLIVLGGQLPGVGRKPGVQAEPQQAHAQHGHHGKGDGQQQLNAPLPVNTYDFFTKLPVSFSHGTPVLTLPLLSCPSGIWTGKCRTAS